AMPGKSWSGKVAQVPLTVTVKGTRNVGEVVCHVDNSDARLLPNTNVTVNISTAKRTGVLSIARAGLHQEAGNRFVFLVPEGKLRRRDIEGGSGSSTRSEVASGLEPDDQVALSTLNGQPLHDDMAVRVPTL